MVVVIYFINLYMRMEIRANDINLRDTKRFNALLASFSSAKLNIVALKKLNNTL